MLSFLAPILLCTIFSQRRQHRLLLQFWTVASEETSNLSLRKDQFNEACEIVGDFVRLNLCKKPEWFVFATCLFKLAFNPMSCSFCHQQALAGLVEIPAIGIAMYIIMKTGKKWLFCSTFVACGISCFLAAIFEGNDQMLWMKITFVMIGNNSPQTNLQACIDSRSPLHQK